MSTHEDEDGITIQREDSTNYRGDILVVAYGDYSGMRQSLYSDLAKQNNLPTSDAAQINIDCTTIVGATCPLDPTKFRVSEMMPPFCPW